MLAAVERLAESGVGMRLLAEICELPRNILLLVSVFLLRGNVVVAHGGGLDSSGGHNCYVGSCAGTYHTHGGSSGGSGFWILLVFGVIVYIFYTKWEKDDQIPSNFNANNQDLHVYKQQDSEIDLDQNDVPKEHRNDEQQNDYSLIKDWLKDEVQIKKLHEHFDIEDSPEQEWLEWKVFKSLYREGDMVCAFDSPDEYWESLCGMDGYALIRDGDIVKAMITSEN